MRQPSPTGTNSFVWVMPRWVSTGVLLRPATADVNAYEKDVDAQLDLDAEGVVLHVTITTMSDTASEHCGSC
jgi:hypothetical protein